jgi:hypothetical protein
MAMATRTLHLVDVDNLLGDPGTTDDTEIERTLDAYRAASGYRIGDHVLVATHPGAKHAFAIHEAWPGVSHRWRRGKDGADMVLLDAADEAVRSHRYGRVVIGSGDRIFLEAMDRLRRKDVEVAFVSRRRSLARALQVRGMDIRYLEDHLASAAAA